MNFLGPLRFTRPLHQFELYHTLEMARNMGSLVGIGTVTKYVKSKTTKKGSEREKLKIDNI